MECGKGSRSGMDLSLVSTPRTGRLQLSCTNSPVRIAGEGRFPTQISPKHSPESDAYTSSKLFSSRSLLKLPTSKLIVEGNTPLQPRIRRFRSPTVRTKFTLLPHVAALKSLNGPPTRNFARTIMKMLETIANEKGLYSEEMKLMIEALKRVVYCRRRDGQIAYFTIAEQLFLEVERLRRLLSEERCRFSEAKAESDKLLQAKSKEAFVLQQAVASLQLAQEPLQLSVSELQAQNTQLEKEAQALKEQLARISDKYLLYKDTLTEDFTHISDLQKKMSELQLTSTENVASYQKLANDHKQVCSAYSRLQDNYDSIVEKLAQTLRRNECLLEEKQLAEGEVIRLREQAAASFDEPASRGSFAEISPGLGVEQRQKLQVPAKAEEH